MRRAKHGLSSLFSVAWSKAKLNFQGGARTAIMVCFDQHISRLPRFCRRVGIIEESRNAFKDWMG